MKIIPEEDEDAEMTVKFKGGQDELVKILMKGNPNSKEGNSP